ncbi:trypsin-like peptidase domain-containing protein [Fontimonas sp. SYSU GA230001]|uniref:trypsin-like serine peptidase n=1 Tax=Fontimonas sp. SYSU GA230001 TaxID=3142450 RepID=UPI0032B4D058
MRRLLLITALCLPLSGIAFEPQLADLDSLPLHVAPAAVTGKAIEAARAVKGSGPALFAVTVPLPVGLDGGIWDAVDADTLRWRTRVYSATARSVVMEFSRFHLPAGAELWIYDADGSTVQGPYTAAHHNPDGGLWTALVPGETAVIELRVPRAARDEVRLQLGQLGHGYKNARDLGDSGACNIDVICPLGDDWRDEIRAAVKLQIPVVGGVGVCSGTLVNNLAENNKPYVLTASHCGIGDAGSPASGVVVYWNFQNSVCGGTPDAGDTQNQTGAVLRARDRNTDLSLIELNQVPSSAYNVYYAGWDASGTGGTSGVTLHHPSGDAKKISQFTNPLTQSTVQIEQGGPNIPAWRVSWAQGTTEQGSSGSGLWNQNRQIVGVLSGGAAACAGSVGNGQPDYYARLETQWQATSQASGQLKAWLDPNNTGQRKVAGRNPGATPSPSPSPSPSPTPTAGGGGGGGGGMPVPAVLCLCLAALARRYVA